MNQVCLNVFSGLGKLGRMRQHLWKLGYGQMVVTNSFRDTTKPTKVLPVWSVSCLAWRGLRTDTFYEAAVQTFIHWMILCVSPATKNMVSVKATSLNWPSQERANTFSPYFLPLERRSHSWVDLCGGSSLGVVCYPSVRCHDEDDSTSRRGPHVSRRRSTTGVLRKGLRLLRRSFSAENGFKLGVSWSDKIITWMALALLKLEAGQTPSVYRLVGFWPV